MALGINREEMLQAARQMDEDREWHDKLQPLIDRYERLSEEWHEKSIVHINSELLNMLCRAKSNVYKKVADDLQKIQPSSW